MKRASFALVLSCLAGVPSCAIGNQWIAGRGEYRLYRETKIATTVEERLAAANRYLKEQPDGRYRADVEAWFSQAEPRYVESAWNSLPRLRAYAARLGNGPSIERVKARMVELESAKGLAARRLSEREDHLRSMRENLDRAAEQRKSYVEELRSLLELLAGVSAWRVPPAALEPALVERLGGGALADSCIDDLCVKKFTPRFALPVEGRLVPRESEYSVELALDAAGAVVEARLRGRELMSRLAEALDLRPVSFADPLSRAEAIGRALTVMAGALETRYPAEGCEKPAVSPVVLERSCNGQRVVATAALETGEDDVVAFGPEPAPAPAAKAAPAGAKGKKTPEKPGAEKKPNAPRPGE